jgi:phosphoribosylamine---glycine ligase
MPLIAPTRTLIVGSGGREHALAWKLASEPGGNEVYVSPGSAGIAAEPRVTVVEVDRTADPFLVALARRLAVELVVIGPEAELEHGTVDALNEAGILTFGPTRAAARIESSKAFCREVAEASGVPMARGRSFEHALDGARFARELLDAPGSTGAVVKEDGLAAGKGVTVCDGWADAERALERAAGTGSAVVVEERLSGREASVIAICDGRTAIALPAGRDHKRARDGDTGPNTGGMGAYSPLPDLPDDRVASIVERFHRPVLAELARRGTPFRGALYAGVILTDSGPRLLEFNARFGDPEAQAVLPRLGVALGPVLLAAARGDLHEVVRHVAIEGWRLPTTPDASVAIVLAGSEYPVAPSRGESIAGIDAAADGGALVFHSGTRQTPTGGWETNGGRILTVVGRGTDLAGAKAIAEGAADIISWPGMQRRHDIAVAFAPVGAAG